MHARPDARDGRRFAMTATAFFLAALAWSALVDLLARLGIVAEALLVIGLPIAAWALGALRYDDRRMRAVVIIETSVLTACLVDQWAIVEGVHALRWVGRWGVLIYFVVQTAGFVIYQWQRGHPLGVLHSLLGGGMMLAWWAGGDLGAVSEEGRYLILGGPTPWQVIVVYVAWVSNAVLVQSALLPCMSQATATGASLVVSVLSGSFLHVRLLTACNAFVLDLIFGYGQRDGSRVARAMALPARWHAVLMGPVARWLPRVAVAVMGAMGLEVLVFGW